MKRDMDLVRDVLLKLEERVVQPGSLLVIRYEELTAEHSDRDKVAYNVRLMIDHRLIEGEKAPNNFKYRGLTWAGHDLLDAIRDPDIWEKTKAGAALAGGFTFDLLKDLAKGFLRKQVQNLTGVEL